MLAIRSSNLGQENRKFANQAFLSNAGFSDLLCSLHATRNVSVIMDMEIINKLRITVVTKKATLFAKPHKCVK